METCLTAFKEVLKLTHRDAGEYSPLALAYIGDAVYELAIRTLVMNRGNTQVNKMHKRTAGLVKAGAQAGFYKILEEILTEEERAVYRRGRNAKSATMAKNATMKDYRMATGFEALMGYLYLTEQFERMAALLGYGLSRLGEIPQDAGEDGSRRNSAEADCFAGGEVHMVSDRFAEGGLSTEEGTSVEMGNPSKAASGIHGRTETGEKNEI